MKNADDLDTGEKAAPEELAFVQGFVNTLDLESGKDEFADPEGLERWLRHHGLIEASSTVGSGELERATGIREGLRALMLANNGAPFERGAVEDLQKLVARLQIRFRYLESGQLRLEPASKDVDGALGALQLVVHKAMVEGTWQRLKACLSESCQYAFYDTSKNRSGAWCSMKVCGNRTKVRRHRERRIR